MYIKNVKVYGSDRIFHEGGIGIAGDIFSDAVVGNAGEEDVYDGKGCYAIPGLIDIHFHGALGEDVCDGTPGAVETIARYEASEGITAVCPATLTLGVEDLNAAMEALGLREAAVASGDQFVEDRDRKRALNARGCDICEMEIAAIARVCFLSGVPCLSIKCISDTFEGGAGDFWTNVERSAKKAFRVLRAVLENG